VLIIAERLERYGLRLNGSREVPMIKVLNNTRSYFNQYYDVTDLPKTVKNEKNRTCNVTCLAMITGQHPDDVLQHMFQKYGVNDQFQWESHLVDYLNERYYECKKLTKHAYPKARKITNDELEMIMGELIKGKVILYHKKGHYQLMIGYHIREGKVEFIFNDPAGDRTKMRWNRTKESGFQVVYTHAKVKREKIYGSCWSVDTEMRCKSV